MKQHSKNNIWHRLALTIGSGMIIAFFSELFFLNEGPTFDMIAAFSNPLALTEFVVVLSLFYGLFALWLLIPIQMFNVRNVWPLFLCAALTGWAIEGIVIPVMYVDLPFSIFWPSMSWHVFVDVFLGWWFLRKLLQKNRYGLTAVTATALGLFWGIWGTWFWGEGQAPIAPASFTALTIGATTLLIIGYLLVDRLGGTEFKPTKVEIGLFFLFSIGIWGISNIAITPLQLIFPVLVLIVFAALMRNRKIETRANIFSEFKGKTALGNLAMLLLMPAAASLTYPFYFHNNIGISETWIVLWPMTVASIIMFVLSFIKIFSRNYLKDRTEKQPSVNFADY